THVDVTKEMAAEPPAGAAQARPNRFFQRVHARTHDGHHAQMPGGSDTKCVGDVHRLTAELNAACSSDQGDVQPIIHYEPRTGAFLLGGKLSGECEQLVSAVCC